MGAFFGLFSTSGFSSWNTEFASEASALGASTGAFVDVGVGNSSSVGATGAVEVTFFFFFSFFFPWA